MCLVQSRCLIKVCYHTLVVIMALNSYWLQYDTLIPSQVAMNKREYDSKRNVEKYQTLHSSQEKYFLKNYAFHLKIWQRAQWELMIT